MTLLNAPAYNVRRENLKTNLFIATGVLVALLVVIALAGIFTGHGWFYSNLYAEHRISKFLTAIETKDYDTAYAIYQNDDDWKQHQDKYKDYPQQRFIEDWERYTVKGGIHSHKVLKSVSDGSGPFGTGIIVAAEVNGNTNIFIYYIRKDGTLSYPAPHIFDPNWKPFSS